MLDSSAALLPFQHGIDIEREASRLLPGCDILVPRPIVEELALLSEKGQGAAKRYARAALRFVARFPVVEAAGRGDDSVVNAARGLLAAYPHVVVATLDKPLRQRVRAAGAAVLYLQGRKTLQIDGHVE